MVPFAREVDGNGYTLSRILGSDGRTLWFDCMGLHGVHLRDGTLVTADDLTTANPGLPPRWWEDARGTDIVDGKLHQTRDFNTKLEVFPTNMIGGMLKFTKFDFFEITDGAERENVKVQF